MTAAYFVNVNEKCLHSFRLGVINFNELQTIVSGFFRAEF
jgi:hypothetical protein